MQDYHSYAKAEREQFDAKHGNDAVPMNGWLIFSDGAMREIGRYGAWKEPVSDLLARAQVKLQYHEEVLRLATEKFAEAKQSLKVQASEAIRYAAANTPLPPPTQEAIERLEGLRENVIQCQANVVTARAEVTQHKPEFLREREAIAEANHERNSAILAAIEKIVI